MDYLKEKLNYKNIQIYSTIETTNLESLKLHLKNGFKIFEIEEEEYTINGKELDGYLLYKNYEGIDNFEKLNKQKNLNEEIKESLNINEKNYPLMNLKIDDYKVDFFESNEVLKRLEYLEQFVFKSNHSLKFQIVERSLDKSFEEFKEDVKSWVNDLQNSTKIIEKSFEGVCNVEFDNGLVKVILNSKNDLYFHPFRDLDSIVEEFNYRCKIMNDRIDKEKSEINNENEELENNDFIR